MLHEAIFVLAIRFSRPTCAHLPSVCLQLLGVEDEAADSRVLLLGRARCVHDSTHACLTLSVLLCDVLQIQADKAI